MAWSVICQATEDDKIKMEERAYAFCVRHKFDIQKHESSKYPATATVDRECDYQKYSTDSNAYEKLWFKIIRRLFKNKKVEGIAYDTLGFYVK